MLRLHGAYGKMQADNTIPVRAPQDFTVFDSVDKEDGELWEAGLGLARPTSSRSTRFWSRFLRERGLAFIPALPGRRASISDATAHVGLIGEWSVDRFLDFQIASSSFRANRYGVYLKWRP